uniref:Uncharacterized protein n=1 Tax=Arundo donax TaxID=35708 RepID=A0A0A9CMN4_ARUDO
MMLVRAMMIVTRCYFSSSRNAWMFIGERLSRLLLPGHISFNNSPTPSLSWLDFFLH